MAHDWEKLPSLPEPNGGFICGVVEGKITVLGGTQWRDGEKRWLDTVHFFDPQEKKWTSGPSLDSSIAYAVGGQQSSGMSFAGGSTGTHGFTEQGHLLHEKTLTLAKGIPKEQAAVLAAGGILDGKFLFVGGTNDASNVAGFHRQAVTLDTHSKIESLPDYPGKPFGIAGSAVSQKECFIFGGATWDSSAQTVVNTDAAYAFSLAEKKWRKLRNLPYAVRGLCAVTLNAGQIYLAGGYKDEKGGFTNEAFIYNVEKDNYSPAVPLPYRGMVGLVYWEGYLYCLGGEDLPKSRTDACYRLALSKLTLKEP
jgi:N-acetylneuraminic acid mutarotase